MMKAEILEKIATMRSDLITLANDEIGMDDYKSQLRRYQILLLGVLDLLPEVVKEDDKGLL